MLSETDKAQRLIDTIADISAKVADASKENVVQTAIATVISVNGDDYTVRLLSSPDDGSQDFNVYSKTTEVIEAGDNVFIYYIGDLTNAYIEMLVDGGNVPYVITAKNISVTFELDTSHGGSYTYEAFPYRAEYINAAITADMIPTVAYSMEQALSQVYAPVCESYNGGVYLYASDGGTVTIPSIVVYR